MRNKVCVLILLGTVLSSLIYAQYSQEIEFKSAQQAPSDFNAWTFFWSMPMLEDGARLDYVVIQPDGKEYFQYNISRRPPGAAIRSDFSLGFAGGEPSVFYGKHVVVKVRVTKGKMRFLPGEECRFEFRNVQSVPAVADLGDSALYIPSIKMQNAEDVRSGVLHCIEDRDSGSPDIVLSDPESGQRMNLTRGRATDKEWSQPWGPVGSPDGKAVIFYQFKQSSGRTAQRNWLLEMDGAELHQLPSPSQHSWGFTWSPKSDAVAYPQGGSIAVVERRTLKMTPIAVWQDEDIDGVAWSPDGKWIACGGKKGGFTLVAPDGNARKRIACHGLDTGTFAWHTTSKSLAVIVNGELTVISLDGHVVARFGQATSVDGWSSDGRYIAYGKRDTGERHLCILSVSDGDSVTVDIPGDCYGGAWRPHGELLVFWHKAGLMAVEPDGKNPQLFGRNYRGSTMPPSWLVPE